MFNTGKFADFPLYRMGNQIRLEGLYEFKPRDLAVTIAQSYFQKKQVNEIVKEGYAFYIPQDYQEHKSTARGGIYVRAFHDFKMTQQNPTLLMIHVPDQKPVEALKTKNVDIDDIAITTERYLQEWMASEGHQGPIWLMSTQNYIKKRNLTRDYSCWEGWTVHYRSPTEDIYCITIRRKYIPPSMDHFLDIVMILVSPFNPTEFLEQMYKICEFQGQYGELINKVEDSFIDDQDALQRESSIKPFDFVRAPSQFNQDKERLTTRGPVNERQLLDYDNQIFVSTSSRAYYSELIEIADSIHPLEMRSEIMSEVIQERCNALLFTEEAADFYKTELQIIPEDCEIQAIRLLRRILYILKRNNSVPLLKRLLHDVTQKLQQRVSFQEQQGLNLEKMTSYDLLSSFTGSKRSKNLGDIWWREKLSRYLTYCLDGGILYEGFNLTTMLDLMKNLDSNDNEELRFVLSRLLFFRREGRDSPPDTVGSAVFLLIESTNLLQGVEGSANVHEEDKIRLLSFCFNERVLEKLILHDWLLHHLNDPFIYTKFFCEVLNPQNYWSSLRLRRAVLNRIITIYQESKAHDVETAMLGRSDALQLAIVPPIIQSFHHAQKSIFILAAEALIQICHHDTYRMFMMRQGVIPAIIHRLQKLQDPIVMEYTMRVVKEITSSKDASQLLFIDLPVARLVDILLDTIKGIVPHIPGAFYTARSASEALISIHNIVLFVGKKPIISHKNPDTLDIIISRINPTPYQYKQSQAINIECEKTIYSILELIITGALQRDKEYIAHLVIPRTIDRVNLAKQRFEDLETHDSTYALLSYLKAQSKDCTEAIGLMAELEDFIESLQTVKKFNKLPNVLLQRLKAVY